MVCLHRQFCLTWISQDSQVKFMSKEHLHFMWENFMWKVNYILSAYDMILWYLTYTNVFMWNSCEKISNEIHVKLFLLNNLQLLVIHVNALFTCRCFILVCVCVCRWSACISPTNTPVSCTWAVFWWMSTEWRPPVNPGCYTC